MRLKFKQGGTDAVIAVTNVHYCKHKVKVFDNKPDDEVDEFGNTYRCGLLVSQQGMPQNTGLMFVGISRFNCNDIVEELLKYGYADISDYEYTDIKDNRLIFPFLDKVQIRNIIYKKSIIKKGEKCTWIT